MLLHPPLALVLEAGVSVMPVYGLILLDLYKTIGALT